MDTQPRTNPQPRALITGATSGIGRAFVHQLAAEGYDVIAVARTHEDLAQLNATPLPADLSTQHGIAAVTHALETQPIDVLINCAGFGVRTSTLNTPVDQLTAQSMVMNESVRTLSWYAVKKMVARGRGGIVNVTSLAAVTTQGTYAAEKAAATIFTESLAHDLRGTPVTCTAVLPGFVATDFHRRMGVGREFPDCVWMEPDRVAQIALRDARAGKVISVPGLGYQLLYALSQVTPRPLMRALSGGFQWKRAR
ncbi:SDR family NAD(P)-dependent oxidoreductase [Brevibacterium sp. UMB1308A]|uniref:SDR family NAD(P)-dependent oxidoreductase n=1 Tax=Brevibacterium sp. UMB1308A TaxID=3050608 RepID=UPI00254B980E|nr:SDR family NAD(P)-dependent oxidoreductase [Brevibacterium sp. UMB1308A]MDK8346222.1 SDR family NAD(P)-dependent oxidoreductase [Brevibacterium sp. UMB1308B]MDK8714503.1 SDR family NAD(P)-dependent oxidoreductase [Brevibacterium sp. UMB1308A]